MSDLERLLSMTATDISRPGDLYEALDALAREIERVLGSYCLGARQLQELAQDLAHLRHSINVMLMSSEHRTAEGKDVLVRYLDLEGRVKELRDNRLET